MSKPGAVEVDIHAHAKVLGSELHAIRLVEFACIAGRFFERHDLLACKPNALAYVGTLGYGLYRCGPNET